MRARGDEANLQLGLARMKPTSDGDSHETRSQPESPSAPSDKRTPWERIQSDDPRPTRERLADPNRKPSPLAAMFLRAFKEMADEANAEKPRSSTLEPSKQDARPQAGRATPEQALSAKAMPSSRTRASTIAGLEQPRHGGIFGLPIGSSSYSGIFKQALKDANPAKYRELEAAGELEWVTVSAVRRARRSLNNAMTSFLRSPELPMTEPERIRAVTMRQHSETEVAIAQLVEEAQNL